MKNNSKLLIIRIITIILLIWALADNPYSYYQILRWIITGIAGYLAYSAYKRENSVWAWIFVFIAILFNPLFPIHLNREAWSFINIIVVMILLVSILKLSKNNMLRIFKSRIFWPTLLVLVAVLSILFFGYYKINQKRIEDAKCKFSLEEIMETRYFKDGGNYISPFRSYDFGVPTSHMVYWEIDSLLKNNSNKKQYLNSLILKIYTADDKNILLTESYLNIKEWLGPNQSLPFQVRTSFNRNNEILNKYFDGEEDVRVDLYPYFESCNY